MSTLRVEQAGAALRPLRHELLRRAAADADRRTAAARADATRTVAQAQAEAADLLAAARMRGGAQARADLAADRAAAGRSRRADILDLQYQAYEQLRAAGRAAVRGLRADPGYAEIRQSLSRLATTLLGPDATLVEDPDGGIVATAGGRRLDLTLAAIADRALEAVAPDMDGLWT
jgi:vacuolar-type H+-ATPase subunit E/Vma4